MQLSYENVLTMIRVPYQLNRNGVAKRLHEGEHRSEDVQIFEGAYQRIPHRY